jgi:hypothetical protein
MKRTAIAPMTPLGEYKWHNLLPSELAKSPALVNEQSAHGKQALSDPTSTLVPVYMQGRNYRVLGALTI